MSIRSIIASPTASGFSGRYVHNDGRPRTRIPLLLTLHQQRFAGSTRSMTDLLIRDHPAGWATLPTPTQLGGCYCHGNWNDEPQSLTEREADPLWHEAVYILHADRIQVLPAHASGTRWDPSYDIPWTTDPARLHL
ncbi:hypothetical protein [Streptacidiphilus neutrinimicus]|uniref:hypothetical protein n=1 Tax=Streptacidiphilus neutrinimicus TaxID=105420 RepID=UPI0005A6F1D2|nr:hypothetical protein [Streptacidiphilus neutrinimicus]